MSKTRFIKVAAIITIIAAGLGTGAFFLQRSYQYNYADIRSVAVNGDAKQLEAVIKHGADVNATDEDGRPVLFWAMRKPGNKDNILILINNGADVNFLYNQVSPLTIALTNLTDKEVLKLCWRTEAMSIITALTAIRRLCWLQPISPTRRLLSCFWLTAPKSTPLTTKDRRL